MTDNEGVSAETEVADLLSDANSSFKLGDWEGNAKDFEKNWISQKALTGMREKDKTENDRQVALQVDQQQAAWLASQQQQAMQRAAVQQQPAPQGSGIENRLAAIYAAANQEHGGYMHSDAAQQRDNLLLAAVRAEFEARDQMTNTLGKRLDEWYAQSQTRAGTLDTLAGTHADATWGKFVDGLEKEYSSLPRATIEALASGYEASANETPDQLREGISKALSGHVDGMNAHSEAARSVKREQAATLNRVGMPGVAAAAVPAKPDKPLTTPDEITDHYWEGSEPAS